MEFDGGMEGGIRQCGGNYVLTGTLSRLQTANWAVIVATSATSASDKKRTRMAESAVNPHAAS
jgi:hypothetical protein